MTVENLSHAIGAKGANLDKHQTQIKYNTRSITIIRAVLSIVAVCYWTICQYITGLSQMGCCLNCAFKIGGARAINPLYYQFTRFAQISVEIRALTYE